MISYNELPEAFACAMKDQLGADFEKYIGTLEGRPALGMRVNTIKARPEAIFSKIDVAHERIEWAENGFYVEDVSNFTRHPFYYAGLYYIQEPTAMTPVTWLDVQPDDMVLDLCAAPGGKSTQIACYLGERGCLYSNDPSASRAKALLKNIELSGISNAVITCAEPEKLAAVYPEFFDRILVDAPCSGEGMFRKNRDVLTAYREHGPEYFAPIQRDVLSHAAAMLKPGGTMVYSTCTFSRQEDEDNIDWFVHEHPEFEVEKMKKLYPHEVRGEGHFVCRLKKGGSDSELNGEAQMDGSPAGSQIGAAPAGGSCGTPVSGGEIKNPTTGSAPISDECRYWDMEKDRREYVLNEYTYLLPVGAKLSPTIHYIRTGLLLGRTRNGRFEPSQAHAMAASVKEMKDAMNLELSDDRVMRYLKCETLEADDSYDGYRLVCVEGHPLGWIKQSGTRCKNKYYPGWRWT
jgi:NOL1/NOP2/sun family putative RNA methylase